MKNLIFIEYPTPYWADMLNSLHEELNFEVYFIAHRADGHTFNYESLKSNAKYQFNFLKGIKICNRVFNFGFISVTNRNSPRIIISREYAFITVILAAFKLLFKKQYKLIARCDDSFDMVNNANDFSIIHKLARRMIAPIVDDIILVEPRVVDWYKRKYDKGILFPIIRNDKQFREKLKIAINDSNDLLNKHKLAGRKVVAFIGRFIKLKNIETIINAFINANVSDTVLLLIGDGPELHNLSAKHKRSDIIFTGAIYDKQIYAYYNIISVLCLISDKEAFGAVVNEALLAGAKVIVSERAGASSLVNDENGYVIDPHDVNTLSHYIKKTTENSPVLSYRTDIRQSLMQFTYEECFQNLKHSLINLT